jgi:catechol 2,3-dioxygenase-like lactoylglutathione lyase family enzyme
MALSIGINHVALLTHDIDAFTAFYVDMFDAEVLFDLDEDGLRHAAVDVGGVRRCTPSPCLTTRKQQQARTCSAGAI